MKRLIALLLIVLVTATLYALEDPVGLVIYANKPIVDTNDSSAAVSAETTVTALPIVLPNYRLYTVVTRLNSISDEDSTACYVMVHSRAGDNGSWATVCSTSFMAAGEVWKSIPQLVVGDTAVAVGKHVADQWRVQIITVDSTTHANQTTVYKPEVIVYGRY